VTLIVTLADEKWGRASVRVTDTFSTSCRSKPGENNCRRTCVALVDSTRAPHHLHSCLPVACSVALRCLTLHGVHLNCAACYLGGLVALFFVSACSPQMLRHSAKLLARCATPPLPVLASAACENILGFCSSALGLPPSQARWSAPPTVHGSLVNTFSTRSVAGRRLDEAPAKRRKALIRDDTKSLVPGAEPEQQLVQPSETLASELQASSLPHICRHPSCY
jgi:hypothetical protein